MGDLRAMRVDIGSARLPWRRMHHQTLFTTKFEYDTRWSVRQPLQQGVTDRVLPARPSALRAHEYFFVVTLDNVRAAFLQKCNDLVGKPVFVDPVAETQQFIDLPHDVLH